MVKKDTLIEKVVTGTDGKAVYQAEMCIRDRSQACVIQKEIGASCPAMDISAACTGFIYALDVAAGRCV